MNKPILAVMGSFTGVSIATLAISYFKYGEPAWFSALLAIGVGTAVALAMYALARWNQKNEMPLDDSQAEQEV